MVAGGRMHRVGNGKENSNYCSIGTVNMWLLVLQWSVQLVLHVEIVVHSIVQVYRGNTCST